ncbi:MAG: hypothetical protein IJL21_02100 [Alphaproteobacteria bacterium]|nr:hypothetical protein [Alphaproteobacteria bacterium]
MKKIISFVGLFAVFGVGIGDAHGVAMSAQVRRLLQEKQEKIEQLEKCEGKKQGWMIAGISTIGLTAVGVGVNIAQASKSNRLSSEIEMEKSTLERHQNDLNRIQNDIAAERAKQAKDEQQTQKDDNNLPKYIPAGGGKYDDYRLTCDTVRFTFDKVDDYRVVLASLNAECQRVMKRNMVNLTELRLGGSDASKVVFECSGYKESITCESDGGIVLNGGIIGQPCAEGIENIANSKFTGVWTRDDNGQYTCNATANDNLPIPCVCKKTEGGNGVVNPEKIGKKGEQTECKEGQVRIGGKGACVKVDHVIAHGYDNTVCKCKDGSANCTLVKDEKGSSVCQYGEGAGEKCSCVEKKPSSPEKPASPTYQLPSYGMDDYLKSQASKKAEEKPASPTYQLSSYGMDDYLKSQASKKAEEKPASPTYQLPSYGMDDYLKSQESKKQAEEKQPVAQGYENPFRIGLPDK